MTTESDVKVVAPRKKGRPFGSKTKNRLLDPTAMIKKPSRPRHYNQAEAAEDLGIDRLTLYRLCQEHEVYQPAGRRNKTIIYTDAQLEIISLVMRGKITPDKGLEYWKQTENQDLLAIIRRCKGESR